MSSAVATQNMSTITKEEMHDDFLKNVNSLKDRQFRFVMANSSKTHLPNPDYAAPELFVPPTPAGWMTEYKQAGGNHSTCGSSPSRLQGLMEMTSKDLHLDPIVEYINNSDNPYIIWDLEKIYKSSDDTDWVEWNCFLFSVSGSLFCSRVTNGSWNKWAAAHPKSWSHHYTEPPTLPPSEQSTELATETPTELATELTTELTTELATELATEPPTKLLSAKASQTAIDNMRACSAIWPSDLDLYQKATTNALYHSALVGLMNRVNDAMRHKECLDRLISEVLGYKIDARGVWPTENVLFLTAIAKLNSAQKYMAINELQDLRSAAIKGIDAKRNLDATIVQILDGTFAGDTNNAWNLWIANNPEYVTSTPVPNLINLIPKASLNVNRVGAPMDRCGYCSPHCRCPYDGPCGDRPEGRNY
jgi:hypothetical protein